MVVSLAILLIVALPDITFDCDSRMHSSFRCSTFLGILPGNLLDCGTSWHSFQF